jgi:hypothetical protein
VRARTLHQRFAAATLLVVWMGMSFSLLAHADGHAHRFCAEHGTIEEGSGAPVHAQGGGQGEGEGPALRALGSAAADPAHAECPLATLPTRDALTQRVAPVFALSSAPAAAPPGRAVPGHPPLSVLALAPKVSPPAAG